MPRDTLLVIDECLPKSLAGTLKRRGRAATSVAALGLAGKGVKDPDLLPCLVDELSETSWVLVTGDDAMPAEHGPLIIETGVTVATIFPDYPEGVTEHEWNIDIVQRWAHAIQDQAARTVRRYNLAGSHPWKPRARHIRTIAKENLQPWRPEDANAAAASRNGVLGRVHQARLPGM